MVYVFRLYLFLSIGITFQYCTAQQFNINGGILLKAEITLGNQNQWGKLSCMGFGTMNHGDMAIESGIVLASYGFLKRHTVSTTGIAYSYDFFAMAGIGKNSNLLGSAVLQPNTTLVFDAQGKGGFHGIGFGVGKDILPKKLQSYGLRRGAILMRFSTADHSIHIAFHNDFKFGLFKGQGTDHGVTGSLHIGYTQINTSDIAYQLGMGIDLFTPQPDHSKAPRNTINSDDGRKNVWYTLAPYPDLFYGNIYAYGTYQEKQYSVATKLGVNSQKAGAVLQNTLHDGLGLNPRFPWEVTAKDKIFVEISGTTYYKEVTNE